MIFIFLNATGGTGFIPGQRLFEEMWYIITHSEVTVMVMHLILVGTKQKVKRSNQATTQDRCACMHM